MRSVRVCVALSCALVASSVLVSGCSSAPSSAPASSPAASGLLPVPDSGPASTGADAPSPGASPGASDAVVRVVAGSRSEGPPAAGQYGPSEEESFVPSGSSQDPPGSVEGGLGDGVEIVGEKVIGESKAEEYIPLDIPASGDPVVVEESELASEHEHPYDSENSPPSGVRPSIPSIPGLTLNEDFSVFNGDSSYFDFSASSSWQAAADASRKAFLDADWELESAFPVAGSSSGVLYSFVFSKGALRVFGDVYDGGDGVSVGISTLPK